MEYEYKRLVFGRHESRGAVRRLLTEVAEYQGWELDRLRIERSGNRTVMLRRKIIRMRRTA